MDTDNLTKEVNMKNQKRKTAKIKHTFRTTYLVVGTLEEQKNA